MLFCITASCLNSIVTDTNHLSLINQMSTKFSYRTADAGVVSDFCMKKIFVKNKNK